MERTQILNALTERLVGEDRHVRFGALDRQHAPINAELHAAFERLLRSNAFTLGTEVEQFESEFASYSETDYCVGVSSGTAALTLILRGYGIGPGDEVIVPAHTFIASALAVVHVGATPVLCDVREGTGLIDPNAARAAITPRTVAIMAVHLYGQTCEMDALHEVAGPNGLLVLEDAAQAVGATYRGRRAGSLAAAAGFSFYPARTSGRSATAARSAPTTRCWRPAFAGCATLASAVRASTSSSDYNERLDGLQAALLSVKLRHLDQWTEARRVCAAQYRELLTPTVTLLQERAESPSVHHVFATRLEHRDRITTRLRSSGIETGVHYSRAVHQHDAWTELPPRSGALPVAEAWAAEELSLPMHPDLTPQEIERVVDALDAARSSMGA